MSIKERTIQRMKELGVAPNKSLGQNFLISDRVIDRIVDAAKALQPEELIEVGPGLGSLTETLKKVDVPLKLIELDRKLAEFWTSTGFEVFHIDALKWEGWSALKNKKTVLVSNLPYQISSSIVIELSIIAPSISGMVLMFQKEVAQKIIAKPKDKNFGMLSVLSQAAWEVKTLLDVSPQEFFPAPKIASRVLVFRRREAPLSRDFLTFTKLAYGQRRKLLRKNLGPMVEKNFRVQAGECSGLEEHWQLLCKKLGMNPNCRAEDLSSADMQALFQQISEGNFDVH